MVKVLAMTQNERTELLTALAELSRRYPDWRLGQLVANVAGWTDHDIWDVEDQMLLEACRAHLESNRPSDKAISA